MIRLLLVLLAAFWSLTPAVASTPRFAVIFEVNLLENGQVDTLVVDHVIDAQSGSKEPVKLAVPESYVAVRTKLNAKAAPPTKRHFFTYFFYDPSDPTNTDFGVEK